MCSLPRRCAGGLRRRASGRRPRRRAPACPASSGTCAGRRARFRRGRRPGRCRRRQRRRARVPLRPIMRLGAGDRRQPLRVRAPGGRGTARSPANASTAGTITPRPTLTPGTVAASSSPIRRQADGAADAEHAEARHLQLEHEQREAEQRSAAVPAVLTGSIWNAKNASSRHRPPATPGRIAPGFHSSTVRPSMPSVSRM